MLRHYRGQHIYAHACPASDLQTHLSGGGRDEDESVMRLRRQQLISPIAWFLKGISSLVASQTTSQLLWKFSFDWLRREMNWFHSGCLCVSLFCRRDKFDKKHQSDWAECPSPHPTNPFPPRAPLRRNLQMSSAFTNWVTWHMCVWFLWKTFWVFWAPSVGTEPPYELMVNVTSPLLPAYILTQVGRKCQNRKRNTHVVVLQLLKNLYLHHQRSNDQWDSASLVFSVEAQWPSCSRTVTTIR